MAGDVKTVDAHDVAAVPVADPFGGIANTLDEIRDILRGQGAKAEAVFDLPTAAQVASGITPFAQHQWQRLHVASIVATASAAGTLIITVGSTVRTFNIDVGVNVIPFPTTIDRGTDFTVGGTAVGLTAFALATAEAPEGNGNG